MAKSTKVVLRKTRNNFRGFITVVFLLFSLQLHAYTDQVVIETPNAVKTIYDIRVHSFFRHLYEDGIVIDTSTREWLGSFFEDERSSYVQQLLAQNFVIENDLAFKPSQEEIKRATGKIEHVFATPAEKTKAFSALNINDDDTQQWIVRRLTFDKFLSSTIQERVIITDEKITNHYNTWKNTRFFNKPLDEIRQKVKDDLSRTLQKEEFEKWVDQEKRREKMILKVISVS